MTSAIKVIPYGYIKFCHTRGRLTAFLSYQPIKVLLVRIGEFSNVNISLVRSIRPRQILHERQEVSLLLGGGGGVGGG